MMRATALAFVMVITSTSLSSADSLYSPDSFFTTMFADTKACKIGDVVHILITESASATQTASRTHAKESQTTANAGTGWLDFIKLMGYGGSSEYSATGIETSRGTMSTRLTVSVAEVLPNGNLIVEGRRHIVVNKDTQDVTIRGEVRPKDIGPDNTVYSYQVANVQIEYIGSDPGKPGNKVGIISRLLNFLF